MGDLRFVQVSSVSSVRPPVARNESRVEASFHLLWVQSQLEEEQFSSQQGGCGQSLHRRQGHGKQVFCFILRWWSSPIKNLKLLENVSSCLFGVSFHFTTHGTYMRIHRCAVGHSFWGPLAWSFLSCCCTVRVPSHNRLSMRFLQAARSSWEQEGGDSVYISFCED